MKNDKIYVEYVLRCIARIEKFVAGGKDEFMTKDIVQDAVLRNLHTLSESTQRVSKEMKYAHTEINWRKIAEFRNVVVHDYLEIKLERIWTIVQNDIPKLKQDITIILNQLQ